MQQLTNRAKVLDPPRLTLLERMYFPAVLKGLGITIKHFFKKKVTIQFPEQKRYISPNFRGLHSLKRDENGAERCTACGLCALSCPAEAITITAAERQPGEELQYREQKYARAYEINMIRCIFCGICEEACPKEAIYLDGLYVKPSFNREIMIYTKQDLLEPRLTLE